MHQMQLGKIKVSFTQVRCPLARAWGATGGGTSRDEGGPNTGGEIQGDCGGRGSAVMQTVESLVSELFDMIGCGEAR